MKYEKIKLCLLIAVVSIGLYLFVNFSQINDFDDYKVQRPDYAQESTLYDLGVYDENGELITRIDMKIDAKKLTIDEAKEQFLKAYDENLCDILGNNESLESVRNNLVLMPKSRNGIITFDWYSSNYEIVDSDGVVYNSDLSENDSVEVVLTLVMKYEEYLSEYPITVTVRSPIYTEKENYMMKVKKELDNSNNNYSEDEVFLPNEIEGKKVTYKNMENENDGYIFIILGFLAIVTVIFGDKQKNKEQEKLRKQQLLYDYSELVSKLTLLMGAGMTIRGAWHKIVTDYKNHQKADGYSRYVYDEMFETECSIESGISEPLAYEQFGKRCELKEYNKLASLLQQNIRKGSKDLTRLLEQESLDAFEQRKNLAKQKGEEAGTKLLIPMIMMLVIVMVIVMVPAMMSFQL